MSTKMAVLDFNKCIPENCAYGVCAAAAACPSKLLIQETRYQMPIPVPFACRACGECVRACPQKAIQILNM